MSDPFKRAAAAAALEYVEPGMVLGLGSGSTAEEFVALLARRVHDGLDLVAIPTSRRTAELARGLGVPLADFADHPQIDLTIDGADEVDGQLRLIKGGGGAHLREKIVAAASRRMIVIADDSKRVEKLGAFSLPVEVVKFGHRATKLALARVLATMGLDGALTLRYQDPDIDTDGGQFVTDSGHFIYDIAAGEIDDPDKLATALSEVPGVVEHGLFIGIADVVLFGGPDGVTILTKDVLTPAQ